MVHRDVCRAVETLGGPYQLRTRFTGVVPTKVAEGSGFAPLCARRNLGFPIRYLAGLSQPSKGANPQGLSPLWPFASDWPSRIASPLGFIKWRMASVLPRPQFYLTRFSRPVQPACICLPSNMVPAKGLAPSRSYPTGFEPVASAFRHAGKLVHPAGIAPAILLVRSQA